MMRRRRFHDAFPIPSQLQSALSSCYALESSQFLHHRNQHAAPPTPQWSPKLYSMRFGAECDSESAETAVGLALFEATVREVDEFGPYQYGRTVVLSQGKSLPRIFSAMNRNHTNVSKISW